MTSSEPKPADRREATPTRANGPVEAAFAKPDHHAAHEDVAEARPAAPGWADVSDHAVSACSVRRSISVEDGSALVIRRELVGHDGTVLCGVRDATFELEDRSAAELALEASRAVHRNPDVAVAALSILGQAAAAVFLSAAIERVRADRTAAIAEARENESRAAEIEAFRDDDEDGAHVELCRGDADEAFWTMTFDERWERDRFWDWMRWQEDRFREFADVFSAEGASALSGRLLREMVTAEKAARAAGLTTSGRRPLRFWCGEAA